MTATKPDFHHLLLSGREFTISFQNQKDSPNSLVPGSKNILFTPTTNYPESKKIDLFTPFKAQVKDGLRSHPPTYREPIKLNQTIPFTFMLNLLLETPDAFNSSKSKADMHGRAFFNRLLYLIRAKQSPISAYCSGKANGNVPADITKKGIQISTDVNTYVMLSTFDADMANKICQYLHTLLDDDTMCEKKSPTAILRSTRNNLYHQDVIMCFKYTGAYLIDHVHGFPELLANMGYQTVQINPDPGNISRGTLQVVASSHLATHSFVSIPYVLPTIFNQEGKSGCIRLHRVSIETNIDWKVKSSHERPLPSVEKPSLVVQPTVLKNAPGLSVSKQSAALAAGGQRTVPTPSRPVFQQPNSTFISTTVANISNKNKVPGEAGPTGQLSAPQTNTPTGGAAAGVLTAKCSGKKRTVFFGWALNNFRVLK